MKRFARLTISPIVPAFFYFTFPQTADAYLDPGTGSIVIQVVIGVAVGGLFAVKLFWHRIKTFLGRLYSRGRESEGSEE